jgi:hypothetical protein
MNSSALQDKLHLEYKESIALQESIQRNTFEKVSRSTIFEVRLLHD